MPQSIHIRDARLTRYLHRFSGVFSLPQWKYFVTVLLARSTQSEACFRKSCSRWFQRPSRAAFNRAVAIACDVG